MLSRSSWSTRQVSRYPLIILPLLPKPPPYHSDGRSGSWPPACAGSVSRTLVRLRTQRDPVVRHPAALQHIGEQLIHCVPASCFGQISLPTRSTVQCSVARSVCRASRRQGSMTSVASTSHPGQSHSKLKTLITMWLTGSSSRPACCLPRYSPPA